MCNSPRRISTVCLKITGNSVPCLVSPQLVLAAPVRFCGMYKDPPSKSGNCVRGTLLEFPQGCVGAKGRHVVMIAPIGSDPFHEGTQSLVLMPDSAIHTGVSELQKKY